MSTGPEKTLARFNLLLALAVVLGLSIQHAKAPLPLEEMNSAGTVVGDSAFPLAIRKTAAMMLSPAGSFAPPTAPALGLVMADFTGDTHPDLATVEVDRFDSSIAHYWIEIRLTEGGHQFIGLTAPFGGLLVTPTDVTGDGSLDLVVRSAQSHAPLAVFLNDGTGHFSKADIARFANALHDGPSPFAFTTQQTYSDTTLACLESHTAECPAGSIRYMREHNGSLLSSFKTAVCQLFFPFGANRAPPSLV